METALERATGRRARIARIDPVGGGSVSSSARLTTDTGERFFAKWNPRGPAALFEAEADGLAALTRAGALRVPTVLGVGSAAHGHGGTPWLLLEWVEAGRPGRGYASRLGEGLAELHRSAGADGVGWGWERDNFIGPLPQRNRAAASWAELWRDARLAPQLARARARGHFQGRGSAPLDRALERTPELLADVDESPSLLHGDLWGGNVFADGEGRPVLVDPAVYRGHREVDLAMSELFGGFPAAWPEAYDAAWRIGHGYHGRRRPLYQLYYLLVHVNLFGAGYEAGCVAAAEAACAEL